MNYVQLAIIYNVERKYFKSTFSGRKKESMSHSQMLGKVESG